jgi:hypothetical protein
MQKADHVEVKEPNDVLFSGIKMPNKCKNGASFMKLEPLKIYIPLLPRFSGENDSSVNFSVPGNNSLLYGIQNANKFALHP